MNLEIDRRVVFAATGGKEHGPNQPLFVFLHGAGMDHSVWALQSRWFAHHGGNVLAVDLPGPRTLGGSAADRYRFAGGLDRAADRKHAAATALRSSAIVWAR